MGHSTTVKSVDFHPSNEDLLCSCDNNSEMRYWSIKNGSCAGVFKVYNTVLIYLLCIGSTRILFFRLVNLFVFNNVTLLFQGGATQMRFQPCFGRNLAAAADNFVSILDVETQVCRLKLQVSY